MSKIKVYGARNINLDYDALITKIKDWTKENFYFNNNLVYYSTYDNDPQIRSLDPEIEFSNFKPDKKSFDTPLSMLIYNLVALGEARQLKKDTVVINKLKSENEQLIKENNDLKESASKSKSNKKANIKSKKEDK
jgi:hypothetical protein